MNKYIFIFLAKIAYCLLSAGMILADYDTAFEIRMPFKNKFAGCKYEYNYSDDDSGWTEANLSNNDNDGNIGYYCCGLTIGRDSTNVFFRIKNKTENKVSDVHFVHALRNKTNFIQFDISDGVANNTAASAGSDTEGHLTYSTINFKLKDDVGNSFVFLVSPERNHAVTNRNVLCQWEIINGPDSISQVNLIIYNTNNGSVLNTNVTGSTNYNWAMDPELPSGVYYWRIELRDADGNVFKSEKSPFAVVDQQTDTDGDTYSDIEELLRCSDPFNAKDIPLILSNSNYPEGIKGLQYHHVFRANRNELLHWKYTGYLPEGLILSDGGMLSGLPKETGVYVFTIHVQDKDGKTDELKVLLKINDPRPSFIRVGNGSFE